MDAALVDLLGRLEDFVQGGGDLGRRDESREKRLGGEFGAVEGCVGIFALDEDRALFEQRESKEEWSRGRVGKGVRKKTRDGVSPSPTPLFPRI